MALMYSALRAMFWVLSGIASRLASSHMKRFESHDTRIETLRSKIAAGGERKVCHELQLGNALAKQDNIEAGHDRWDWAAALCDKKRDALSTWYGRRMPYAAGAIDATGMVAAVHYFGGVGFDAFVAAAKVVGTRLVGA